MPTLILQDPKCFEPVQMFCARPKIELPLVPLQKIFVLALKLNLLNTNHLFVWHKRFGTGTICKSILFLHKKFGPAQTILGPVKGQGII